MSRRLINREWGREKSHLIRNLFDDVPGLSVIPEESRSEVVSLGGNCPTSYSPLPDLIIEKAPNRHDEPEGYYEELAIRMRKLHRKLLKIDFGSNRQKDDGTINSSINVNNTAENIEAGFHYTFSANDSSDFNSDCGPKATENFDESNNSSIVEEEENKILEPYSDSNKKHLSTITEESEIESNAENNEIIIKSSYKSKTNVDNDAGDKNSSDVSQESRRKRSPRTSILSFERNEIEVMRNQGNMNNETTLTGISLNKSEFNMSSADYCNSSEDELNLRISTDKEIDSSVSFEFQNQSLQCSSPNVTLDDGPDQESISNIETKRDNTNLKIMKRNRHNKEEEMNNVEKRSKINVVAQTDDTTNSNSWNLLKFNLFVGVPKIYNLCSCKNHKCQNY